MKDDRSKGRKSAKEETPQGRKSIVEFVYAQLRTQATELSDDQSRQLAASLTRQVISEVSALLAAEVALQTTEIAAANTLPLDPKGGR